MPPKLDINKSGWENAEFPSVCEKCLGANPYIRMTKEEYGKECKVVISGASFLMTRFARDRIPCSGGYRGKNNDTKELIFVKRVQGSRIVARLVCWTFNTASHRIQVRDAALKLVAQGPQSSINREYFAQNNEGKLKDGDVPVGYNKADSAARDLLKRLAKSEPYYRREKANPCTFFAHGNCPRGDTCPYSHNVDDFPEGTQFPDGQVSMGDSDNFAPARTNSSRRLGSSDLRPPVDKKIKSLMLTGVEDDLTDHAIRTYFMRFGPIRSLVVVHKSRAAIVNFATRQGAEAAAEGTRGEAIVQGCPLRVSWSKPRPLAAAGAEEGFPGTRRALVVSAEEDEGSQQDGQGALPLDAYAPRPMDSTAQYQSTRPAYEEQHPA
ncbi:Pre-mRNA-splicing factor slt11 [Neolecta irregularis DAH-3]|uniref:Pre-mRNA-splicing factor slt11 n=1 Tax=Neolecta irregularis (strain DAH-3) TaxID=1198029 RepID=A0A1U7LHK5_NEOID|nr:Pre-mRNA-splicing factor slt11 [Neolecta irregularis DAH-3]|eukprot:OLL22140.1 Pre-mRNA-splicing factor slt11 [Neolecta irregularis DAH-3]